MPYNVSDYNSMFHVQQDDGFMKDVMVEDSILHQASIQLPHNIKHEKTQPIYPVQYFPQ